MQTETIQTDNVDKLQKKNHRRKVNEQKNPQQCSVRLISMRVKKSGKCVHIFAIFFASACTFTIHLP